MKRNIYLIIICCLTQFAFGQGRSCDIKANFISHSNGYYFKSRSTEHVQVSIINLGPDSLRNNDNFMVGYVFGGGHIFPKFRKIDRLIVPGDSIVFNDSLDINYDGDVDSFNFCVEVYAYNSGRDSIKNESGKGRGNNKYCIWAKHKRLTMSLDPIIEPQQMVLYPNPTTSHSVTVLHPTSCSSVKLFNGSGQLLASYPVTGNVNTTTLNLRTLPYGIYTVQVEYDEGILTKKLVIK